MCSKKGNDLEHKSDVEQLRELRVLWQEMRRLRRDLFTLQPPERL